MFMIAIHPSFPAAMYNVTHIVSILDYTFTVLRWLTLFVMLSYQFAHAAVK